MMQYLRNHPLVASLVGLYLLLTLIVGLYALTCSTQWCSLVLVIPLTPWPQLEGLIGIDLPRLLLPLGFVFNVVLLIVIGRSLEKLFIHSNQ